MFSAEPSARVRGNEHKPLLGLAKGQQKITERDEFAQLWGGRQQHQGIAAKGAGLEAKGAG